VYVAERWTSFTVVRLIDSHTADKMTVDASLPTSTCPFCQMCLDFSNFVVRVVQSVGGVRVLVCVRTITIERNGL